MTTNRRETGARKLEPDHRPLPKEQDAALPKKPKPYGLTESIDEVEEKTRHSDGVNPRAGSPRSRDVDGTGSDRK